MRRRGRAVWRKQGPHYELRASHTLAALHLLALTGKLEIRLTPGEVERLQRSPRSKIRLPVSDHQPNTLAQSAYTLLQQLPNRNNGLKLRWLFLLALLLTGFTFVALDYMNQTGILRSWLQHQNSPALPAASKH